jgi:hypothetical protein
MRGCSSFNVTAPCRVVPHQVKHMALPAGGLAGADRVLNVTGSVRSVRVEWGSVTAPCRVVPH